MNTAQWDYETVAEPRTACEGHPPASTGPGNDGLKTEEGGDCKAEINNDSQSVRSGAGTKSDKLPPENSGPEKGKSAPT